MFVTNGYGAQQFITQGYGDFGTHSDLSIAVVVPASTWPFVEAKPSDGYTLEAEPTLPGAADGFWTDGTSDGFYDEWPVDGFYGAVGYQPEPKPLRRATPSLEEEPN